MLNKFANVIALALLFTQATQGLPVFSPEENSVTPDSVSWTPGTQSPPHPY
jgi:hypothetical protein